MSNPKEFDPEEMNENLFKTTAITFSLEGISRDLETYMQKKITFNNRNFKHMSDIMRSISTCDPDIQKTLLVKRNSILTKMLEETYKEMQDVNALLSYLVHKIMDKEIELKNDLKDAEEIEEGNKGKKDTTDNLEDN